MSKPSTDPVWATDGGTTLEPSAGEKAAGWSADDKPPARWFNWWMNLVYQWVQYLGGLHSETQFLNKTYAWIAAHTFTPSASNTTALTATGNGTGHGIAAVSGAGASATALTATCGAGNHNAISATGGGTGAGIACTGGSSSGAGLSGTGGASSGTGVEGTGGSTNGIGVYGYGTGTGYGVRGSGGTGGTGGGGYFTGGTNCFGVGGLGDGTGRGGTFLGGASGDGAYAQGGNTSGHGLVAESQSSSAALFIKTTDGATFGAHIEMEEPAGSLAVASNGMIWFDGGQIKLHSDGVTYTFTSAGLTYA